jgi:hypothetical protein
VGKALRELQTGTKLLSYEVSIFELSIAYWHSIFKNTTYESILSRVHNSTVLVLIYTLSASKNNYPIDLFN